MRRATDAEVSNDSYYPYPGFFSRSHTAAVEGFAFHEADPHVYAIDGNWEAGDFSRFYAKIEDLYSILVALAKTPTPQSERRQEISQYIRKRLWRGGGSYVGFYDDLFDMVREMFPLGNRAY